MSDEPVVWYEDDRRDIPAPAPRDPNDLHAAIDATLFRPIGRLLHPGRFVRRVGTLFGGDHVDGAANVNRLDEVLNSTWFTNRIGLFPLEPAEVARGPAVGAAPAFPWTVIRPKVQGVTPGFDVRDANGQTWVIKFDARGYPSMATAAGVIAGRIFHAIGYNVPDDRVVTFTRDQLLIAPTARIAGRDGPRPMTADDLDALLARVERNPDGAWRAIASRYLTGRPVGPFDWRGRRPDDPNDHVDHEDRREMRGLAVFAEWLCHYDTKQGNTLDMYVEDRGRHYVRHYLIDFASTLGAGGLGPFPAACYEYSIDVGAVLTRALGLGFLQDAWRRLERPAGRDEIGYYEHDVFYPGSFKGLEPNTTFANLTDRDGYWAAKILSAFTDAHLAAIVAEGRYRDVASAEWMVRTLAARRDAIARYWFRRVPPLDFARVRGQRFSFRDLAVERGLASAPATRYRYRASPMTATRQAAGWTAWRETAGTDLPADREADAGFPFMAVEVQGTRGSQWSGSVIFFYARASGRIVAVER